MRRCVLSTVLTLRYGERMDGGVGHPDALPQPRRTNGVSSVSLLRRHRTSSWGRGEEAQGPGPL